MLGSYGAIALERGLTRTHRFAQARFVFAVARSRCQELFDAPASVTLWKLPANVEDQFDEHWQSWLNATDVWRPLFDDLAGYNQTDLVSALDERGLISAEQADTVRAMRRSAEGRAVRVCFYVCQVGSGEPFSRSR